MVRADFFSTAQSCADSGCDRRELPRNFLTGYRYTVSDVIRSFSYARTEALFCDEVIARRANRKLEALNAAGRLEDLAVPPSNRLKKLKGTPTDFYSIRINDQWRVIFKWVKGEPHEVRIVDYH